MAQADDGRVLISRRYDNGFEDICGQTREEAFWVRPLPDLDDEKILDYVRAFKKIKDKPALLHLTEVGDKTAKAKLVFSNYPLLEFMEGDEYTPDYSFTERGNFRIIDQDIIIDAATLPKDAGAGDLVIASDFSARIVEGGAVIRLQDDFRGEADLLARNLTLDELEAYFPVRDRPRKTNFLYSTSVDFETIEVKDRDDLETEIWNARKRLEPDEALVLWLPDEHGGGSHCCFLGHTGYVFHMTDAPSDCFYGADIEPGLWVCKGATFWSHQSYEGEHDWGIEADWIPATESDFERFGYDRESLEREIKEYVEEAWEEGKAIEVLLEMANAAAQKDLNPVP